jgi:hypothetical protein
MSRRKISEALNGLFVVFIMSDMDLDVFGSTLDRWIRSIPIRHMVFSLLQVIGSGKETWRFLN